MLSDRYIRNIDWKALLATVLLAAVGLLFVYSATSVYGAGSEFRRQLVFVAVGLVALFIVALMDYRDFGRFAWIIYIASVLLLVAVRFIGGAAKGAQRWIYIGGFSLQPSEIAKLAVIIAIAKFFSEKKPPFSFKDFLFALIIIGIPTFLVVSQPDLGTGMVFIIITYGMFFLAGFRLKNLIASVVAALLAIPPVYMFGLKDYQKNRIRVFRSQLRSLRCRIQRAAVEDCRGIWQALGEGSVQQHPKPAPLASGAPYRLHLCCSCRGSRLYRLFGPYLPVLLFDLQGNPHHFRCSRSLWRSTCRGDHAPVFLPRDRQHWRSYRASPVYRAAPAVYQLWRKQPPGEHGVHRPSTVHQYEEKRPHLLQHKGLKAVCLLHFGRLHCLLQKACKFSA